MNAAGRGHRGGAPVGFVCDLEPVEASAVLYLRLWCEGEASQHQTARDFDLALGREQADEALDALSEICGLCQRHGRRPLMRHGLSCKCVGADEACFAHFIAAAAEGAREDAMMMALLMVPSGLVPTFYGHGEIFGRALRGLARPTRRPLDADIPLPQQVTIH